MWHHLLYAWLGFLYPPHCLLCKKTLIQKPGLCEACAERAGCLEQKLGVCTTLNDMEILFLTAFHDAVRQLIHMLKYGGKTLPGKLLGEALGKHLSLHLERSAEWVVVPVPLFAARKRERGYNQSAIIARAAGRELGLDVCEKALKRVQNTPSQTHLDRPMRFQNVADAFEVRQGQQVAGRSVILVDDVVTTGATVVACAQALIRAGATRVVVGAIAHPQLGEDGP